ncbi:unnamed protein product [Mycena citricolor]|uniref:HTH CENPB-type domain-containing protein n=1 Tax=Mycena citricolor TaxID=2018698 RepID=A0AAD2K3V3_9AGAR|nr:unnamed protein product [Mycena citricolor]
MPRTPRGSREHVKGSRTSKRSANETQKKSNSAAGQTTAPAGVDYDVPVHEALEKLKPEERLDLALGVLAHCCRIGHPAVVSRVAVKFGVPGTTLSDRWKNRHKSMAEAAAERQFLSPSKERVLLQWATYLGSIGVPLSKKAIRKRAAVIRRDGKKPSRNWVGKFLKRNPDLILSTASGLDPKRAQAFNQPVVNRYFDELTALVEKHGIPMQNIYNMDEKGCQRGGGKKAQRVKYFYSKRQTAKYRHRSANLELITILEAVCADGSTTVLPGFVFPGKEQCPEWFDNDIAIQCVPISCIHQK